MGDVRFGRYYATLHEAADPASIIHDLPDEAVIAALAAASRENEPYLANILATEAMNRALRWGALFSSLGNGIVVLGPTWDVVALNPAAEALLGWSPGEARGLPWDVVLGVTVPEGATHEPPFASCSNAKGLAQREEQTFHRRDGAGFQAAYVAAPIAQDGEVRGVILVFQDVTTRRERERKRREGDQALVALAKDPIFMTGDLDAALTAITQVTSRVLGVSRVGVWVYEEGRTHIRCIHMQEDNRRVIDTCHTLAAAEYPVYFAALETERTVAVHNARTDPRTRELDAGYLRPLRITSMLDVPIRIEGSMRGIVCHEHKGPPRVWTPDEEAFAAAIADMASIALVTDARRKAEAALHEERMRLQDVVEHASVVIFALDNEGRFTLSAGRGLEFLGLRRGEVVGRSVFEVYRHNERVVEDARRALSGECFNAVVEESGRIFETRWTALRDHRGDRTAVVGVAIDITERTNALRALRASEARFADLVNAVDGIVWEGEPESFRYMYVSRHAESILGYPVRRWIDEPDFWPRHIHPDDRERVVSFCRTKTSQLAAHAIEYRMIAADGRVVWLRDIVTVLADGGHPRKAIGVMVDITELKAAEAELAAHSDGLRERVEARTQELRAANEELEAFSRSVSHDLRGHLRGIDALSEALLEDEGPRLAEESRRSLQRLRMESRNMGALVDNLLKFSLALGGGLKGGWVDLSSLAEDAVRKLRDRDRGRAVEVVIEPGVQVWGDAALLSLVVENLIGNAWKYTSRTPQARIEMRTREGDDGERVVTVRDNGAGFALSDAGLLFRPFQRLHTQAEFAGTGIGLATVRRIVERHGGRVWAEGEKGKGATFSFVFPPAPPGAPPRPPVNRAGAMGPRSIERP